jgi:hypothetical protein
MRSRVLTVLIIGMLAAFLAVGAEAAELPKPEPVTISVPKVEAAITLDGNLGEAAWASAYRTNIPRRLLDDALSGTNEVSGEGRVFWNDDGLYFGIKVNDRRQYFVGDDGALREYDSVEVWLEKLWIQAGFTSKGQVKATVVDMGFTSLLEDEVTVAATKTSTGYTVEVHISNVAAKAILGQELRQGGVVRLAFGINNRYKADEAAKARHYFPDRYTWNNQSESFAVATLK